MKPTSQNPIIGEKPTDTIHRSLCALEWLTNAEMGIEDVMGGEPNDDIQLGRYLLFECCFDALKSAELELGSGCDPGLASAMRDKGAA